MALEAALLNARDAVADQCSLAANPHQFLDPSLQKGTEDVFHVHLRSRYCRRVAVPYEPFQTLGVIELWPVCVMKRFTQLSLKDWNVLFVCLSSVVMIEMQLAAPRVLAVMVGIPVVPVSLRVSTVFSNELPPYFP